MRELRKKQKRLFKIMKAVIIFSVAYIVVYMGAYPYILDYSRAATVACSYICDFLIILSLCLTFIYYGKYGKCDSFLNTIEHEIDDCGYYLLARSERENAEFLAAMQKDFSADGYAINTDVESDDFTFDFTAFKKNEYFYAVEVNDLSREDVIAYIDEVINDLTVHRLKRKGGCVICFVTDKAREGAAALSKMITPIGKKEQLKIAVAIAEPSENKCYFLGNMQTKCQQLIANYVMRCDIPIKDKYKGERRLAFQDELEERMKEFTPAKFKDGTFYAH